jgi:redox-sensitive bicupin YhaK (pirin superfamily)
METRKIIARTAGVKHGPIIRVMSPSDRIAEIIKPFVFLDYFKLDESFGGFGMHPHSGIATLTFLIEGEVDYIDTSGKAGMIMTGGLEWMQAGGGAWHAGGGKGGAKRGFQLWIALPSGIEDGESKSFYASPEEVKHQGPVQVLLGSYGQAKSPFETPSSMNYLRGQLKDGERWVYEPPQGHTVGWVYAFEGELKAGERIKNQELTVFEPSELPIEFEAVGNTAFILGSSVPHKHHLVLGRYSVHTNAHSLENGEKKIKQIERRLVEEGKLLWE